MLSRICVLFGASIRSRNSSSTSFALRNRQQILNFHLIGNFHFQLSDFFSHLGQFLSHFSYSNSYMPGNRCERGEGRARVRGRGGRSWEREVKRAKAGDFEERSSTIFVRFSFLWLTLLVSAFSSLEFILFKTQNSWQFYENLSPFKETSASL